MSTHGRPRGRAWAWRLAALAWCILWCASLGPAWARDGISPELSVRLTQLGPADTVKVLVHFRERADLARVAGHPPSVLAALKAAAQRSQPDVLRWLATQRAGGAVKAYRPLWIVNAAGVECTADVARALAARPEVELVALQHWYYPTPEHVEAVRAADTPAADTVEWNLAKIRAPEVWAAGVDGTGVVVGIIDTGVDYTHPDLARAWRGYPENATGNWFDAVHGQAMPYDDAGHGTHTLGTVLGGSAGGSSIGVAPGAKWIAAKSMDADGGTDEQALAAMEWMLDPDGDGDPSDAPRVVSNSWGIDDSTDTTLLAAVAAWVAAGIFPSFSIGNHGASGAGSACPPGNYPDSFGVGATTRDDVIASFSSRGPAPAGPPWNGITKPDVCAPGVAVWSSVAGGGYASWDGTSMACPHVTGAVALLLSASPALTVDELKTALRSTAVDLGTPGPDNDYGAGRIDAYAAVEPYLLLSGSRVSGHVQAWDGTPVGGAVVTFTGGGPTFAATTDAEGDFARHAPSGTWTATASYPGYAFGVPQTVTVPPDITALTFTGSAAPGALSGVVTELVVTPTRVESQHPYPASTDQTWVIETGGTKSQVHFQYVLLQQRLEWMGEWVGDQVRIYDQNDRLITSYSGHVRSVWTPWVEGPIVKVRLTSDASIYDDGFVVDAYAADTGGPAEGVTVTLTPGGRTAITDAAGAFSFTNVAPLLYGVGTEGEHWLGLPACVPASVSPGATVSGAVLMGVPYRYLVYDSDSLNGTLSEAMAHLGYAHLRARAFDFGRQLAAGPWDLVAVDAPQDPPDGGWGDLLDYVGAGGRVSFAATDLTGLPDVTAAFGASAVEALAQVPTLFKWQYSHPLFGTPWGVRELQYWSQPWTENAVRLLVTGGDAYPVGGFTAPITAGQAALVVGNGGRTILNGFLWDAGAQDWYSDGILDTVKLAMNEIVYLGELRADFSTIQTSGAAPLGVEFIDRSTGGPTSWLWDFGDGGTSTDRNPIHTYATAGSYTVTLTVANAGDSDMLTRTAYITVSPTTPSADFYADPEGGLVPLAVQFTDLTIYTPTEWAWDFGDGSTSTEQSPSYTYTKVGAFTVALRATNAGGSSTYTRPGYVRVTFTDLPLDQWAVDSILACVGAGIVTGYADLTYHPANAVTRDQMAVYIARALAAGDANVPAVAHAATFPDVPSDYWAFRYVEYCYDASVVAGYWDGYHPTEIVSRAQMAVYVARSIVHPTGEDGLAAYTPPATASFPDVATDYWAYKHIEYCKAQGIVSGYWDGYHPADTVTRDQMAVYVARAFQLPM